MQGCRETGVGGPAASGARCAPMGKGATGGLEARDFPPLMPVQVRPRAPFPLSLLNRSELALPGEQCV